MFVGSVHVIQNFFFFLQSIINKFADDIFGKPLRIRNTFGNLHINFWYRKSWKNIKKFAPALQIFTILTYITHSNSLRDQSYWKYVSWIWHTCQVEGNIGSICEKDLNHLYIVYMWVEYMFPHVSGVSSIKNVCVTVRTELQVKSFRSV